MSSHECAECGDRAEGKVASEDHSKHGSLLCVRCMVDFMKDGIRVEQLEIRKDLVARVQASIKEGHYDETTLEGQLALHLAVDKVALENTLPKCPWDGKSCGLAECVNGCHLDRAYERLTGDTLACGHQLPVTGGVLCDRDREHLTRGLPHGRGWGPAAILWDDDGDFIQAPGYKRVSIVCLGCGGTQCPRNRCHQGKQGGA